MAVTFNGFFIGVTNGMSKPYPFPKKLKPQKLHLFVVVVVVVALKRNNRFMIKVNV